jgi:Dolichyl-phosphate-mannose-protein mannosyltransferase
MQADALAVPITDSLPAASNETGLMTTDRYGFGQRTPVPGEQVALALAVTIAAWACLAAPWLLGYVTIPWDAKAQFQPQVQFLAASIAKGESPFWAPYVFSGHPQIADPQSLIFSPPFLLLALVTGTPSARAIDTTLLLVMLSGGVAVLLWFLDRGWHWAGGVLAAIVFFFGASMAWRIQHTGQVTSLVYMAWTLWAMTRALERRSIGWGLAAGVFVALMILGRDQVALLGVYVLAAYALWHLSCMGALRQPRTWAGPVLAGGLVCLLLIALPIALTASLAAESNRPAIDLEGAGRGSMHPAHLLTLFAPDVFGASGRMEDYWGPPSFAWNDTGLYVAQNMGQIYLGAIPVLLILIALLRRDLWRPEIRFFTIAAGFLILYALGWYTPLFQAAHTLLPGVALYRRPADATFLIGACGAILAGYGLHRLMDAPFPRLARREWIAIACMITIAGLAVLGLGVRLDRVERAGLPLIVSLATLSIGAGLIGWALWARMLWPGLALAGLLAFTVADLAWHNGPSSSSAQPPQMYDVLEPATRNETIGLLKRTVAQATDPTRRDRIELVGLGFHWPNASLTHGFENTLGYNPVRLGDYTKATGAEDTVGLPEQRKFSPLFPSYRSRLADLLGLRFVASKVPLEKIDKKLKPGDLTLIARTADALIYENPRALPRVLFAGEAQWADFPGLMASGQWPAFDPRRTVLLLAPALGAQPVPAPARPPGTVRIAAYRHSEVILEADSPQGGFVVLNDLWHPWWSADVEGAPAPVLKANVLFRAVEVPAGKHVVRFSFRPIAGVVQDGWARWSRPAPLVARP